MASSSPPRPLAPGDVVAVHSPYLGEWTAAQIITLDGRYAGVLELDWSGPEPCDLADVALRPLVRTHHAWDNELSYCNQPWVLPRQFKILGNAPLLHDEPSRTYGGYWLIGLQLRAQRAWDNGIEDDDCPWAASFPASDLVADPALTDVRITDIAEFDCGRLVGMFPRLTDLALVGRLGSLINAERLNELTTLRRLEISDLYGMTAADCPLPARLPSLELISLDGIPAEYAAAVRSAWKPEAPQGVYLDIHAARKPEWVAENLDNPLRDWDGRPHISAARYKKAVAAYKTARRAVLAASSAEEFDRIGRAYAEAFNQLNSRTPFLDTADAEDLLDALSPLVEPWALESLHAGIEAVRDW
ncbi:hypothetical protein [Kutzneria chonburiensis]|uniref:Uncharacterized protein n=1 Tax=Kutzneria chonburiensis TaxID=1483604 RepID=A0ABV6MK41_9PSEU|nr:hypothetical protein [Kutzneria chonburiensis]